MGSGVCVSYAGGTFAQDEEAKALIVGQPLDNLDEVRNAVEACPTGAITLTMVDEGES